MSEVEDAVSAQLGVDVGEDVVDPTLTAEIVVDVDGEGAVGHEFVE